MNKKRSFRALSFLLIFSFMSHNVQAIGFSEFRKKLAGYRDCILRRRPCTAAELVTLSSILATLLTFVSAIGLKFGYEWYKEQMALSWQGMEKLLNQYIADVRQNLPMSKYTSFRIDLLKKMRNVIKEKGLSPSQISEIQNGLDTLIGGNLKQGAMQHLFSFTLTAGSEITYEMLKETFDKNLARIKIFGITPGGIYTFLGLGQGQGAGMSADQIKAKIKDKVAQLRKMGKYSPNDLLFLDRQLEYVFNTSNQKKQYDAFLQGPGAVSKLKVEVDSRVKEKQIYLTTEILDQLNELRQQLIRLGNRR